VVRLAPHRSCRERPRCRSARCIVVRLHADADTIVWHNGGTGGYRSFIGFVPSRKAAVVTMTNSAGAGAHDIGMHLLDPALPLAPKPA
jgi:CubicO group peptidase (beta-lactamase class C family)